MRVTEYGLLFPIISSRRFLKITSEITILPIPISSGPPTFLANIDLEQMQKKIISNKCIKEISLKYST